MAPKKQKLAALRTRPRPVRKRYMVAKKAAARRTKSKLQVAAARRKPQPRYRQVRPKYVYLRPPRKQRRRTVRRKSPPLPQEVPQPTPAAPAPPAPPNQEEQQPATPSPAMDSPPFFPTEFGQKEQEPPLPFRKPENFTMPSSFEPPASEYDDSDPVSAAASAPVPTPEGVAFQSLMLHVLQMMYQNLASATHGKMLDMFLGWSMGSWGDFHAKLKETREWSSTKVDENYRLATNSAPQLGKWIDIASALEQKILLHTLGLSVAAIRLPAPERVYHSFVIGAAQSAFLYPSVVVKRKPEFANIVMRRWKQAIFQSVSATVLDGPIPLLGGRAPAPLPRPPPPIPPPQLALPPPAMMRNNDLFGNNRMDADADDDDKDDLSDREEEEEKEAKEISVPFAPSGGLLPNGASTGNISSLRPSDFPPPTYMPQPLPSKEEDVEDEDDGFEEGTDYDGEDGGDFGEDPELPQPQNGNGF